MAKAPKHVIRATRDMNLLGEIVYVGLTKEWIHNQMIEGLVVKEHPVVRVKLDEDNTAIYNPEDLWVLRVNHEECNHEY